MSEGSSLQVFVAARDLVHAGWKLLHHPLYGNYRPYQQPYRSLMLRLPAAYAEEGDAIRRVVPDAMSLHLIEEALLVYGSVRVLTPEEAPPSLKDACALLDYELMRLPLEQAGWLEGCFGQSA